MDTVLPAAAPAVKRDAPLVGRPHPHDKLHPRMYAAECAGTALLLACGLSFVILMFGQGSPVPRLVPDPLLRRAIAGFLFGCTGLAVAVSPLGRISGAHINPAVTFAFWLEGKIAWRDALLYGLAQCVGGVLGSLPLLAWGATGRSIGYGASLPLQGAPIWAPLLGEVGTTMALVLTIFVLAAHRGSEKLVPFAMPPLFSLMVALEAPLSGTSTNPARSLGPALLAGQWQGQWIYVAGPTLGAALAVLLLNVELFGRHHPHEARLFHFRHHDALAR